MAVMVGETAGVAACRARAWGRRRSPSLFVSSALPSAVLCHCSEMGKKQHSPPKAAGTGLGKGKVTPVQIAFLVHRYLSDNGFSATVASFQSEAVELFGKTRSRDVPRGLLGLAEILDEYVSLKEQRITVGREQQRVDALVRGIHDAVQAYRSGGGICSPADPALPSSSQAAPAFAATPHIPEVIATAPVGRIPFSSSLINRSSPGPIPKDVALPNSSLAAIPDNTLQPTAISAPLPDAPFGGNKRKNSKTTLNASTIQKKHRGHSQSPLSTTEGTPGPSKSDPSGSNLCLIPARKSTPVVHQNVDPPLEGSPIYKSFLSRSPDPNTSSASPRTPQYSQGQKASPLLATGSVSQSFSVGASRELSPSKCAIISSRTETVVASPLKNEYYYSVEKSYCISSSPLELNQERGGKRDCIKGRLDFGNSNPQPAPEKPAAVDSPSSSSGDHKLEDIFDFDLSDFDVDFPFAELLSTDLACEELVDSYRPSIDHSAGSFTRAEGESRSTCSGVCRVASVPCLPCVPESKNRSEGHDSVASLKTRTKCTKSSTPVSSLASTSV